MSNDMREYFYSWLEKNVQWDDWDILAEKIKAHDEHFLFICFIEGVRFATDKKILDKLDEKDIDWHE